MGRSIRLTVLLLGIPVLGILGANYLIDENVDELLSAPVLVEVEAVPVPTDEESLQRGEHFVTTILFCQECHGDNLEGRLYFDDPLSGQVAASNLTRGIGGVASRYQVEDWVRSIRHGVDPEGRALMDMPSDTYNRLSDRDLGAVIAYLQSLPAVDNELPDTKAGPLRKLNILLDPSLVPAQVIDHQAPRPPDPEPAISVEYGRYLAMACTVCHGENYAGGRGAGAGLNLTPGGELSAWTEEQFIQTVRTGTTPLGYELDPELMPWERVGQMTDDELRAIWQHLRSLTAVDTVEK